MPFSGSMPVRITDRLPFRLSRSTHSRQPCSLPGALSYGSCSNMAASVMLGVIISAVRASASISRHISGV